MTDGREFSPELIRPRLYRECGLKVELACLLSARKGAAKNKTMAGLTQYSSNNSWYMNWDNENLNNNNKNNNNYVRAFAAKRLYAIKRKIGKMIAKGWWKYIYISGHFDKVSVIKKYRANRVIKQKALDIYNGVYYQN